MCDYTHILILKGIVSNDQLIGVTIVFGNEVITKNNGKQWENADLGGTKQNTYRSRGFDGSYSKM